MRKPTADQINAIEIDHDVYEEWIKEGNNIKRIYIKLPYYEGDYTCYPIYEHGDEYKGNSLIFTSIHIGTLSIATDSHFTIKQIIEHFSKHIDTINKEGHHDYD